MVKIVPFHNTPKIIWLDTNIINDITDAITNKRIDADIKSRSLLLYFKLQKLVNEEKIISPFLNQRDEYINTSVYELSDSILMALGKGKQLQTYLTEYIQIKRMIKIYIENSNQFYLDKQDIPYYFEEEDKKDNKFRDNLGFKRTILQTGANKEGIDRENEKFFDFLKRRKEELSKHNKKFDEVLHEELLSRKNLFESTIKQIKEEYGYIKTDFDYLTLDRKSVV